MQTIDLCDVLTFWENPWIQIIPEYCNLPSEDSLARSDNNYLFDNLVYKAASILKEETGYSGGALIQLRKIIPSASGLGGGSSDAAATLKGLNRLWSLGLSREELARIGAKVGSDVPFFIYGGTCLVKGRGETVTPIRSLSQKWLIIILLPFKISQKTAKLYSYIKPSHYSSGKFTEFLVNSINENDMSGDDESNNGSGGNTFYDYLFNSFEMVYSKVFKSFDEWIDQFKRLNIYPLHLAGSGPAVYYISDSESEVKRMIGELDKITNLRKYIARTVP